MFKKIVVPTAILGVSLVIGGQAKADEVDHTKLVDLVNNNPTELNESPIQAGAYNVTFTEEGNTYHFESDGSTWSWSTSNGQTVQPVQETSKGVVEPVEAPKVTPVQEKEVNPVQTPAQETPKVSKPVEVKTTTTESTGGSVKAQFLQAGGTEAMWDSIVMPESTGNPNASNGQYTGLFQTNQASFNANNSVAQQTKGAIKYAKERYGSVENAISERQVQGWW